MHHLLDRACELHHFQPTNSSAHKTSVKKKETVIKRLLPSPSAVQEEKNTSIWITTKGWRKKLSNESSEGKEVKSEVEHYQPEISWPFPHWAAQNHRSSNGIQADPGGDKGHGQEPLQGGLLNLNTSESWPSGCVYPQAGRTPPIFTRCRNKTEVPPASS